MFETIAIVTLLTLLQLAASRGKAAFMPAVVRPRCILRQGFVGQLILVLFLVVYYRIAQISRLNLAPRRVDRLLSTKL